MALSILENFLKTLEPIQSSEDAWFFFRLLAQKFFWENNNIFLIYQFLSFIVYNMKKILRAVINIIKNL